MLWSRGGMCTHLMYSQRTNIEYCHVLHLVSYVSVEIENDP